MPLSQAYPALDRDSLVVSEEETTFYLLLPRGAQVRSARLRVGGVPYVFWEDLLAPAYGATVSPPFETGTDNARESLVVDFHGLRAVDRLRLKATWPANARYGRLQAWAGITWHQPQPSTSYIFPSDTGSGLAKETAVEVVFPELELQKLMLSFHSSAPATPLDDWAMAAVTPSQLALHCRSVPSNLSLHIGDGPPFWTYSGPLSKTLATPDFAPALNDYLAGDALPEDQPEHHVPLVISSATVGEVSVALEAEIFFVVDCFADGAKEKTLAFGCNQPWTQAVAFELPEDAVIHKAQVKLSGEFAGDRFVPGFGPAGESAGEPAGEYAALVSAEHWVAQAFSPATDLALSGVDLLLTCLSETAELVVEIQPDINQAPPGEAEATVELALDSAAGGALWYCLDLSSPLELEAGKRYWLVLKGKDGQAGWQAQAGNDASAELLRFSKDQGQVWTAYDLGPWGLKGMRGRLRLRHLPASYELPIAVRVGAASLDLGALAEAEAVDSVVDLECLSATGTVPIDVRATSAGQLTLSGLYIEHSLEGPAGGPPFPPLGGLPVQAIDGVGHVGAQALQAAGIQTIADLADLDRHALPAGVSRVRLFEFQRKARQVLDITLDLDRLGPLLDMTLADLQMTPVVTLGQAAGLPLDAIVELKEMLRALQVSLDNRVFKSMTLADLAPPGA
jgi:hypothetical protein